MDDRTTGLTSGLRAAPVVAPARPRGLGLSWKLLFLTVLFVMASEVLIYVPSIANFRSSSLADRLTMPDTSALVIVGSDRAELPPQIQNDLPAAVRPTAHAICPPSTTLLLATRALPPTS